MKRVAIATRSAKIKCPACVPRVSRSRDMKVLHLTVSVADSAGESHRSVGIMRYGEYMA